MQFDQGDVIARIRRTDGGEVFVANDAFFTDDFLWPFRERLLVEL